MTMDLDDLLAKAAGEVHVPSAALLERIAADAAREQPRPAPGPVAVQAAPQRKGWGWGLVLADLFGGSGGVASLTLAAASGLWIGVAQPAALASVTDYLTGTAAVELLPSDSGLWADE